MQGEFCHACGQSVHSVLKPMHHMVEETIETVLHVDGRIVHTLPPLLLKPGFLTLEYFGGRRVRYIAPFRLMFVLCLLTFFVCHMAVNQISEQLTAPGSQLLGNVESASIDAAHSAVEVRTVLRKQLDGIERARATGVLGEIALQGTDLAAAKLRQKASDRLVALGAEPMSAASIAAPLPPMPVRGSGTSDGDAMQSGVQQESDLSQVAWLLKVVKDRLGKVKAHAHDNLRAFLGADAKASAEAKQRMVNGVFSTLPATMFVLIPVFAGLLKLFYMFRRRLYMEHLIVALHSHALMFLGLLLITLSVMLSTWLRPHAAWTGPVLGAVQFLLLGWTPVYLLIMQKRVYGQGWPMTVLKFWFIGWFYFWLLIFALTIAAALGMAH